MTTPEQFATTVGFIIACMIGALIGGSTGLGIGFAIGAVIFVGAFVWSRRTCRPRYTSTKQ